MRHFLFLIIFFISITLPGFVSAETVFHENIRPSVHTTTPLYSVAGLYEWADDIPFEGSHLLSSFAFSYRSTQPLRAYFRFYGVDQNSGFPGTLIAEIVRELPANTSSTPSTIQLTAAEQFYFSAEPNLNRKYQYTSINGAWFSVQFEQSSAELNPGYLLIRQARGGSRRGMYNMSVGSFVATFDPDGFLPGSMYLQLTGGGSTTVPTPPATPDEPTNANPPRLADVSISPSTIYPGGSAVLTIYLQNKTTEAGVFVDLQSSREALVAVPDKVEIPAGQDHVSIQLNASYELRRDKQRVKIRAQLNNDDASVKLKVKRN